MSKTSKVRMGLVAGIVLFAALALDGRGGSLTGRASAGSRRPAAYTAGQKVHFGPDKAVFEVVGPCSSIPGAFNLRRDGELAIADRADLAPAR
jgi:hypothetical protein